jgi:maltooligosyltrehalose trehalohydrolase
MSAGRAKVAAALLLTSPFVPMLFQGEEWGASTPFLYFTDHQDPELGRAVSEGRRGEFASFGWDPEEVPDPQDRATFERSKLDWAEPAKADHAELLAWHRELLALRRRSPSLTDGRLDRVRVNRGDGWLVVERGVLNVVVNLGTADHQLRLLPRQYIVTRSDPAVALEDRTLNLPPDTVAILAST